VYTPSIDLWHPDNPRHKRLPGLTNGPRKDWLQ